MKTTNFCFVSLPGQLSLLIALSAMMFGCGKATDSPSASEPVAPENALSTFEVEPGFKIELLASEPLVADPVDMEIDEYGRLYVVEMHGYPLDKSGSGVIKLLSDEDGDGQMDQSTVFAEGLTLPNGIMRWKKGVLVTDAPNVLYLEDTDGDGQADRRDTVLTGFSLSNPHVNVNNPVYGLDNWVYLAHRGAISTRNYEDIFGDQGDEIYYPDQPEAPRLPKNADSRSVRFRPDRHEIEMMSSQAQFGHTFDAWGHYILGDNQVHIFQEVIPGAYLRRNPDMPISNANQLLSDHGNAAEVFQITKNPERQLFSGVGVMTSASGINAYLGGLFPAPFDQNVTFVCESVSNLVHADHLEDDGASFTASRVGRANKEFLASTDAWFRPVNTYIGPDGALYVLDYYRQIIEHPEWMSDEAIQAGGLYNGKDKGRIYRITPTDTKPADWTKGFSLGDAPAEQLVEKLASPNGWWRMNAQRLLLDRADKSVVPALVQLAKNTASPLGRLHALWTLEGMQELSPGLIEQALQDSEAGVRENAIKLAELHLSTTPALANALLPLQTDPSAKVKFQLLLTLGSMDTPQAAQARNHLLFENLADRWMQYAALSASSSQTAALLTKVLDRYHKEEPAYATLVQQLTTMIGAHDDPATIRALIRKAVAQGSEKGWSAPVLEGLAQGMKRRAVSPADFEKEQTLLVSTCFDHPSDQVRKASLQVLEVVGIDHNAQATGMEKAVAMADDRSLSDEKRAVAIDFMALGDPAPYASHLKQLITPQEQPAVQRAALNTLGGIPGPTATDYVLQAWPELTPSIRDASLNIFMKDTARINLLLNAIQEGNIQPASLGWSRSAHLMGLSDDKLRNRARALLAANDDQAANEAYQPSLQLEGKSTLGKTIYQQNCALCHQVRGDLGVAYGPDLGTVQNWLPKDIMANILAPNLSIAAGYDLWAVELKNGETLQGIISSETSTAITLRTNPGAEKMINRQDIKSLQVLDMSVMPVLTTQINQEQMADLLAFLRQSE